METKPHPRLISKAQSLLISTRAALRNYLASLRQPRSTTSRRQLSMILIVATLLGILAFGWIGLLPALADSGGWPSATPTLTPLPPTATWTLFPLPTNQIINSPLPPYPTAKALPTGTVLSVEILLQTLQATPQPSPPVEQNTLPIWFWALGVIFIFMLAALIAFIVFKWVRGTSP